MYMNIDMDIFFVGKSYEISYIKISFQSPRPESFAIFKKVTENSEWMPFQYYSASCGRTYNKKTRETITSANEESALCTDTYSDISPLSGGSVSFSPLEGRPGAFRFQESDTLQVRVSLSMEYLSRSMRKPTT